NFNHDFSNANLGSLVMTVGSIDSANKSRLINASGKTLDIGVAAIYSPFVNEGTVNVLSKLILGSQQVDPIGGAIVLAADSNLDPVSDLTLTATISGDGGLNLVVPKTVMLGQSTNPGFINNSYKGP